jgi:hypothetical protein
MNVSLQLLKKLAFLSFELAWVMNMKIWCILMIQHKHLEYTPCNIMHWKDAYKELHGSSTSDPLQLDILGRGASAKATLHRLQ